MERWRALATAAVILLFGMAAEAGEIHDAAKANDAKKVEQIIKKDKTQVEAKDAAGDTPLLIAAREGSTEVVRVLLKYKARMDVKDNQMLDTMTPLHNACYRGRVEIVKLLLDNNDDIESVTERGQVTPLGWAAWSPSREVMKLLIDRGANLNVLTGMHMTALEHVVFRNNMEAVKLLVEKGADVNQKDKGGETALDRAIGDFHRPIAEYLAGHGATLTVFTAAALGRMKELNEFLEKDANAVNARDHIGFTPLHYAAMDGEKEAVVRLLAAGADPLATTKGRASDSPLAVAKKWGGQGVVDILEESIAKKGEGGEGQAALPRAAEQGFTDIVRDLLTKGANVNMQDKNGRTALHYAAENGNADLMHILLRRGADVNMADFHGVTPFTEAATQEKSQEVALEMLKKGAKFDVHSAAALGRTAELKQLLDASPEDVDKRDGRGATPLYYAVAFARPKAIDLLIQLKADANARAQDGLSPFFKAVLRNNKDAVKKLIAAGADLSQRNKWKFTPLHSAAWDGFVEIADLLIANGVKVDEAPEGGVTPLHAASDMGQKKMVQFLIAKGADVNAKDAMGHTPLFRAMNMDIRVDKKTKQEVIDILKKAGAKE